MDTTKADENRQLNEDEVSRKKTVLESRFQGLGIALTSRCNLRCIMCRVRETEWDVPERTVAEVHAALPFLRRVYWQGGEAFCSRHFEGLFDAAARCPGLLQEMATNGLLIDRSWAEKLARANARVTFSIDGTSRKVYEHIRRGAKYADMTASIGLVRDERRRSGEGSKLRTAINFVVMRSNYREIPETPDFAREYGIDDLTLTPVQYLDDEENIFLNADPGILAQVRRSLEAAEARAREYGIRFHSWIPDLSPAGNGSAGAVTGGAAGPRGIACLWPWQNLFVDIGGDVKPNCICAEKAGNVRENTLAEIWNNKMMQDYRRKLAANEPEGICSRNCIGNFSREDLFRIA